MLLENIKEESKNKSFYQKISIIIFLLFIILGLLAIFKPSTLEYFLNKSEIWYGSLIRESYKDNIILLLLLSFLGGFIGSISPCIIAMLPLNLGYIGTLKVNSKKDAFIKAISFVSGVVLVTSLFGLVSGFAGAVIIDYKGYFLITISLFILVMAGVMSEFIRIPLPSLIKRVPTSSGPFFVGMSFALISSPCSSPILASVLALSGSSGNIYLSILTMASYGFGYTFIIFLASLFTSLSKQLNFIKYEGEKITKFASIVLLLTGFWSFYQGVNWFL